MNINDGTTSKFTAELEITATRLASGRAVTRFNSDLISGRCMRYTGNVSSPRRSSEVASMIRLRYLLYLSPRSLLFSERFLSVQLRWTPPHWRHALPPTLSSFAEGECTHACTHTRTQPGDRRASATRASRVHRR